MNLLPTDAADPRVLRTRLLLEDALHELLRERPYPTVTVKDIAAQATVNRATFYAHFADKDDLFRSLLRNALDRALSQRLGDEPASDKPNSSGVYLDALLPAAFEYADWASTRCRTARHGRDAPLPEEELRTRLEQHLLRWLDTGHQEWGGGQPSAVVVARAVGAMVASVATDWARTVGRPPAAEVAGALREMVLASVDAARARTSPAPS